MAAVSYLENIDVRPLAFKSYNLPWEAILKEQAIKTQQFAQSASQVQQAYKRNLDLDPQFQQNKDYLKNYMLEADKQLAKVVKSDMTIQDNASTASSVYNNIFDVDKNPNSKYLLTDDGLNKFYKGEAQKAEQARTTNGGKDWTAKDDFWWKKQYEKYINAAKSGDVSQVEELWQTKRGFVPHYDGRKELLEIQKACHENKSTIETLGGISDMIKTSITQNGVNYERMNNCLNMASGQLKEQNARDSYYDYYSNPDGLVRDYKHLVVDRYDEALKHADIEMLALKANKKTTPEQLAAKEKDYQVYKDNAKEANSQWQEATKGNPLDYVTKNMERISAHVGWNKFQNNMAKTLSWSEFKQEFSSNAAGIAIFNANKEMNQINQRFNNDKALQRQNQMFQWQVHMLDGNVSLAKEGTGMSLDPTTGQIIGASGTGIGSASEAGRPITQDLIDESELPNLIKDYNTEKDGLYKNMTTSYSELSASLENYIKNNKNASPELKAVVANKSLKINDMINLVDKLDKNGIKDTFVTGVLDDFRKASQRFNTFRQQEQSLISKLPKIEDETYSFKFDKPGVGTGDLNINFTKAELVQMSTGLTVKGYKIKEEPLGNMLIAPNGEEISTSGSFIFQRKYSGAKAFNKEYTSELKKLTSNLWVSRQGMFELKPLPKKQSDERLYKIEQAFGLPSKSDYEFTDVRQDKDGTAYARVVGTKKGDDGQTFVYPTDEEIQKLFPGIKTKKMGTKTYVMKQNVFPALPETLDTDNVIAINAYTEHALQDVKSRGYIDDIEHPPLHFKSKSGTIYILTIGYNGDKHVPIYKLQRENNGKLITENPIETTDVNAILAQIQD